MLNRLFDNFSDKTNKSVYHTDTQNRQQNDKKHIKYRKPKHSTFFMTAILHTQKQICKYFYMFNNIILQHPPLLSPLKGGRIEENRQVLKGNLIHKKRYICMYK